MSHPSIFELARFVETGTESAAFEHHVDGCDVCAQRLSQVARRAVEARGLSHQLVLPRRPLPAVVPMAMALLACVAVLVSAPTRAAQRELPRPMPFAPEGLHGTPLVEHAGDLPLRSAPWLGDAGPGSRSD